MSDRLAPTREDLLALAERALMLSAAEAADLLVGASALVGTLTARIMLGSGRPAGNGNGAALLTAEEAASRLGLTARQVYRRADRWPFTRRLGPKTLRFDAAGLELYLGRTR